MKSCSNYRTIKMMCHEDMGKSSSSEVKRKGDDQQHHGVVLRRSTTDVMLTVRVLMEKYREGQKELHCVFLWI